MQSHIGIIGGGIAGSTAAIKLSQKGYKVTLFESGLSLVNGPPICHLHAGGNLYRELPGQACLTLLEQSIETLIHYRYAINFRPTIIATPNRDQGHATNLLPRLRKLQNHYQRLITQNPRNKVLGEVEDYFKVYTKLDLKRLAKCSTPQNPTTSDQWMITFAKSINIDDFRSDFYLVQEYGVSLFRLSAGVELTLHQSRNCQVLTEAKVQQIAKLPKGWLINYSQQNQVHELSIDYLINAAGFRSGEIDDFINEKRQRLAEIKSAYLVQWPQQKGKWPEVIFHGLRGTANGMASLTPYPNGHMQIHGMTEHITLFKGGLSRSTKNSARPQILKEHLSKVENGWNQSEVIERTQNAIDHVVDLVPSFSGARMAGPPLFGIQQIPGEDPANRTADASFVGKTYARIEIIKLSSALTAARKIIAKLQSIDFKTGELEVDLKLSYQSVKEKAEEIATQRGFPSELALRE